MTAAIPIALQVAVAALAMAVVALLMGRPWSVAWLILLCIAATLHWLADEVEEAE